MKNFQVGDHVYYEFEPRCYHHAIISFADPGNEIKVVEFGLYSDDGNGDKTENEGNDKAKESRKCSGSKKASEEHCDNYGSSKSTGSFGSSFSSSKFGSAHSSNSTSGTFLSSSKDSKSEDFKTNKGVFREVTEEWKDACKKWKKKEYPPDQELPSDIVLSRIIFLKHYKDLIPPYDLLKCNCECVAVWLKGGHFCSLQLLPHFKNLNIFATIAPFAATMAANTVTVPAAGIWGFVGFTTTLATAAPLLVPAVASGCYLFKYAMNNKSHELKEYSRAITEKLNREYNDWYTLYIIDELKNKAKPS